MRILTALLALLVTSCSTLNVGTILAHRNTSAEDFDPSSFRVAVIAPDAWRNDLELETGVDLSWVPERGESIEPGSFQETFRLVRVDEFETLSLLPEAAYRQRPILFALDEGQYDRAEELKDISTRIKDRTDGDLFLSFIALSDESDGDCAAYDERLQVYFRPSSAYAFRAIFKNRKVSDILGQPDGC